ncbi:unnamed protein product [Sordaria macrospora k-hell]|uniref:WGS project CABT00000000 data, contig 2.10 n=1 Tax=Sordaria macrospora (strain ATCC MYA-333 / DSM 997 / K(L3346) / K-hell) TaxID=771870 RepID=F7VWE3_SORMK|nr:uncharacterized protein SMAC_03271 [Sordaria macrospora k-hell]CCC09711.1 unnamed protein product [Sordaria macrospora k-hell]
MAPPSNPRSVSDATRFTPTTPHASSKSADPRLNASKSSPKEPKGTPRFVETPEQRVARLRAAHLKAKQAQVSRMDRIINGSRRFFDSAHKVTVLGLIGFTVMAGLVTAYTAADMIMYNKKRKAEFIEAQKKMEADSLEAARLAYITGKATEEQTALVEEYLGARSARPAVEASDLLQVPQRHWRPDSHRERDDRAAADDNERIRGRDLALGGGDNTEGDDRGATCSCHREVGTLGVAYRLAEEGGCCRGCGTGPHVGRCCEAGDERHQGEGARGVREGEGKPEEGWPP